MNWKTSEVNLTNRVTDVEERISGLEDEGGEMGSSGKENVKSKQTKNLGTKHPGNLWHIKRSNLQIIGIEEEKNSCQKHRKYF